MNHYNILNNSYEGDESDSDCSDANVLVMEDGEAFDLSNLMPPADERRTVSSSSSSSSRTEHPTRRKSAAAAGAADRDLKLYPSRRDFPVELNLQGILESSSSSHSSRRTNNHLDGTNRTSFSSSASDSTHQSSRHYDYSGAQSDSDASIPSSDGRSLPRETTRYEYYEYSLPRNGRNNSSSSEAIKDFPRRIDHAVQNSRWRNSSSSSLGSSPHHQDNVPTSSRRRNRTPDNLDTSDDPPLPRSRDSSPEQEEESYRKYRYDYLRRKGYIIGTGPSDGDRKPPGDDHRRKKGDEMRQFCSYETKDRPRDSSLVERKTLHEYQSSRGSQNFDDSQQAYYSSSSSDESVGKEEKMVEVVAGQFVPLRGSAETWKALQCGRITGTNCHYCKLSLVVVQDADMVMCPGCRVISSVDGERGGGGGGLGLGMSLKDARYEVNRRVATQRM